MGADDDAVTLAPYFSPKVAEATVELVKREWDVLRAAKGDASESNRPRGEHRIEQTRYRR
jgi:hypothetical protein